MSIKIRFGECLLDAEIYNALGDDDKPTGRLALFAKHAGQVGKGASVIVDDDGLAVTLRSIGYRCVTVEKP